MAERPDSWNALTASFAACGLEPPGPAWAFAVLQGLVRDDPGDRDAFLRAIAEQERLGPITGPTLPARVAEALRRAGIVLPPGEAPDPWARTACERLAVILPWGGLPGVSLAAFRRLRAEHGGAPRRKPWWRWWRR